MDETFVSIVIPTYNRKEPLLRAIDSLRSQTLPQSMFEVIVVDDGSDRYDIQELSSLLPSNVTLLQQENQGATAAKNAGARRSCGEILIFMDDDIVASPLAIQSIVETCLRHSHTIVIGNIANVSASPSVFAHVMCEHPSLLPSVAHSNSVELSYVECNTQLLCVRKTDFHAIGMFQDVTGGWPNWDDVEFGYRANLQAFCFRRSMGAVAYHHDYSLADLQTSSRRWWRASKSAAQLADVCPGILEDLRMFREKRPVAWRLDSRSLIFNKIARQIVWSPPVMWAMQKSVRPMECIAPKSFALVLLYRWILSGYIFLGFRAGLKEARVAKNGEAYRPSR